MSHLGKYSEKELSDLKKKGLKPGTKEAHKALKRKIKTSDGYMKS